LKKLVEKSNIKMVFTLTSIAIEVVILLVIYRVVFFTMLKRNINQLYASRPWWDYLTTYRGLFSKNTQIEVVYITLLGSHHFLGGFAMLYAYFYDTPALFGHAALWELVDDINDLVSMVFLYWPFEELDPKMLVIMGFHHLAGVIIIIPVLMKGLYQDHNLQVVGIALLLAGGVSCTGLAVSRTMDRRVLKEARMDFVMWLANLSFFSLCRFYIFPQQLYLYFEKNNWESNNLFIAAAICMMVFNVLIFLDALNGTFARMLIAFNLGKKHEFNEKSSITQEMNVKSTREVQDSTTQKKTN